MANVGREAAAKAVALLIAPAGLNANVAALAEAQQITLPGIADKQILTQNVSNEVVERSSEIKYPVVQVYCEKIANQMQEKFRTFSGKAHLAIEVRFSQDRLEDMDKNLQWYVDAITQVLDRNRGDWSQGMFYGGGYEVVFGPVKHGGKNFIQMAKVTFEVGVSSN